MRGRSRQTVLGLLRGAATDEEAECWARYLRGLETAPKAGATLGTGRFVGKKWKGRTDGRKEPCKGSEPGVGLRLG